MSNVLRGAIGGHGMGSMLNPSTRPSSPVVRYTRNRDRPLCHAVRCWCSVQCKQNSTTIGICADTCTPDDSMHLRLQTLCRVITPKSIQYCTGQSIKHCKVRLSMGMKAGLSIQPILRTICALGGGGWVVDDIIVRNYTGGLLHIA